VLVDGRHEGELQMTHFEEMLTGGHPNSLGRTIEVVNIILSDASQLEALYQCYFSTDEVVRLRTSSVMKRIWREQPTWLLPYINRFIHEISAIQQASTQWTIAQLFLELDAFLTDEQRLQAIQILQKNLESATDWIVLINTIETLATWAVKNISLKNSLQHHLIRLAGDPRKSVSNKASKSLKNLSRNDPKK